MAKKEKCGGFLLNPEDGGSMFLRNVGIYLQVHTTLQPKRTISTLCFQIENEKDP
jgi:hypothetical protein